MDEPPSLDRDRSALLAALATASYTRLVGEVITRVRALPDECRQLGYSALFDVWEEFKAQVQGEESVVFRLYEDTIERICADIVMALPRDLQLFLWLWSDEYERLWVEQDTVQLTDYMHYHVADELYRRVCGVACDEPLPDDYCEPSDDYPEGE